MTFIGIRIENGEFEVGFKASSRVQYEEMLVKIAALADLYWSPDAALDLSRDLAEPPQSGDFVEPAPTTGDFGDLMSVRVERWDERREWLKRQGLLGADDEAVS